MSKPIKEDYRAAHRAAKKGSVPEILRALLAEQIRLRQEYGVTDEGEKQFSHALDLLDKIAGYEIPTSSGSNPLAAFQQDED
jgi:hypothetical protein